MSKNRQLSHYSIQAMVLSVISERAEEQNLCPSSKISLLLKSYWQIYRFFSVFGIYSLSHCANTGNDQARSGYRDYSLIMIRTEATFECYQQLIS